MRYHLFICRHAKAENPTFHQADYDRDLTEQGRLEASQAGEWLQQSGHKPDLIVCSSARRTLSTASIIANKINYYQRDILSIRELYDSTKTKLLHYLTKIDKNHSNVLLVGHNPGVSMLIATLCNTNRGNVPTGSVHHLWFEMEEWNQLEYTKTSGYETNIVAS
ncbi:hypothetical protein AHMF7605_04970 [Adhaeribacter arboris]|uniref:Phosphohistidine phosphatase n=1 Tax=Adhaeribacter arboris TaxID=2072846 RepID=A0A2T2YBP5_9BACT|nr:histidine phosphatase family protein [Adhaeribacter arboris]PSR52924.1 hypothetical protein AHMF7605_04970 [Adhaeribacter arboris]